MSDLMNAYHNLFANGLEDRGSISGRFIPKTQKMVLDATQHNKIRIKSKVEQSREWSSGPPLHLSTVAIEKGSFGSPLNKSSTLLFFYIFNISLQSFL